MSHSVLEQEKGAAAGGNTTKGGLPSSLLDVTLSPARDGDQLRSGHRRVVGPRPSLSAADRGPVIGWDEDTRPLCYYSGYRFPTETVSYAVWMSEVVIALDPDNGR